MDVEDEALMNRTAMCISIKSKNLQSNVGIAIRKPHERNKNDTIKWEFISTTIVDDNQYSFLESLVVQYCPNTCFISTPSASKKVLNIMELHDVKTVIAKPFVRNSELEEDLQKLLRAPSNSILNSSQDSEQRRMALQVLIHSLDLTSDSSNIGMHVMTNGNLHSNTMRLDGSAIDALNLLPSPLAGKPSVSNGSVLQVLSKGKTLMGQRLLERWIRMPLLDISKIRYRQDVVGLFLAQTALRNELLEGMKGLPDLDKLIYRLDCFGSSFKVQELVRIYDAAKQNLPNIYNMLKSGMVGCDYPQGVKDCMLGLCEAIENLSGFLSLVEEVIDMSDRSDLKVNPNHDPKLMEIQEKIIDIEREVECEYNRVKETVGSDVKCEKDKLRGFVFRLTKKNEEARLSKMTGIHICQVLTNGVHFNSTQLRLLGKQFQEAQIEFDSVQAEVLAAAIEIAATYVPVFESLSRSLSEIDVLLGFSHAAAHAGSGYCRPILVPAATSVKVVDARHPCLELQDGVFFVPNDYMLDKESSRLQIITGANMGGKSTYIRSLGTIAVMAQIGSFVPATEAELPVFDRVLARVGAGDAQQRGVSTFMAEMLEAAIILDHATHQSLVIVDELGRGTSTFDGYGLASAICHKLLTEKRCFCLFATHFHELTSLSSDSQCSGASNKHVTTHIKDGRITMVYEVKPGPCLQSYGINVAALTKFPESVIKQAKRKAEELENFNKNAEFESIGAHRNKTNEVIMKRLEEFARLPLDQLDCTAVVNEVSNIINLSK